MTYEDRSRDPLTRYGTAAILFGLRWYGLGPRKLAARTRRTRPPKRPRVRSVRRDWRQVWPIVSFDASPAMTDTGQKDSGTDQSPAGEAQTCSCGSDEGYVSRAGVECCALCDKPVSPAGEASCRASTSTRAKLRRSLIGCEAHKAAVREKFPAPREDDCKYGCCKAGDEGLWSEMVR